MVKLIVASLAFLFLVEGVQGQQGGPGQACVSGGERRRRLLQATCDEGLTCNSDTICKIMKGSSCKGAETHCESGTFCQPFCLVCKVKEGDNCTPGVVAFCLGNATCVQGQTEGLGTCQCETDYSASDDKTQCTLPSGGVAGLVASLTMMAASCWASRLF